MKSKLEIESGTQQMVIIQTIFDRKVGKEEWLSTQFFRRTNQILRTHKNGRLLLVKFHFLGGKGKEDNGGIMEEFRYLACLQR